MEINYIILAHKNPNQVKRLVSKLNCENTFFTIHIDKNVNIEPFYQQFKGLRNVHLLEDNRKSGTWGDIEIVKGLIEAIKYILKSKRSGYTILLSGQDYPLHNNQVLKEYLSSNYATHYMDFYQSPGNWEGYIKDRISRYKINKSNKKGHFLLLPSIYEREFYQLETIGKLNFLRKSKKLKEAKTIFRKRDYPENFKPYGGSVYWAMPTTTLRKLFTILEDNPDFLTFHKYSLCADEIIFQSLLKKLEESEPIKIQPSLTYVNWDRKPGPLPVTFRSEDYEELIRASKFKFFARKFDIDLDKEILDKLDQKVKT